MESGSQLSLDLVQYIGEFLGVEVAIDLWPARARTRARFRDEVAFPERWINQQGVGVARWALKNQVLPPLAFTRVITYATLYGRRDILEEFLPFLRNKSSRIKHVVNIIENVQDVRTLRWWIKSGLEIWGENVLLARAAERGDLDLVRAVVKYMDISHVDGIVAEHAQPHVLKWLLKHRKTLHLQMSHFNLDYASMNGYAENLFLIGNESKRLARGIHFEYTEQAVDVASARGHIEVLNWWFYDAAQYGLQFTCSWEAFEGIENNEEVLNWWKKVRATS